MNNRGRLSSDLLPIAILATFLLLLPINDSIANETVTELVINTTGQQPLNTPEQTGFMDLVATEALSRIGIKLKTIQLPAERGLKNTNAGIDDGEMSRIAGLEKHYPNLIRVPEKIMEWEFVVFSPSEINLTSGWQELKPYSVSFINGWKILENSVPSGVSLTKVKNPKQLFNLLQKKRVDLVIYERWGGLHYLKELELDSVKMRRPPLAVREMYVYLHKKHKAIVPKLNNALKQMKKDGSYNKLVQQILEPLN